MKCRECKKEFDKSELLFCCDDDDYICKPCDNGDGYWDKELKEGKDEQA